MPDESKPLEGISWYQEMRILGNRFFWWDLAKISPVFPIAVLLILALSSPSEGEAEFPWWIVGVACAGAVLACVVGVVGSSAFYGGRWGCTYRVDADGVAWELGERELRIAERLTAVAGALGRRVRDPASRSAGNFAWSTIWRASFHPVEGVISLKNRWRVVLRLYVPKDDWAAVEGWVRWGLAEGDRQRASRS